MNYVTVDKPERSVENGNNILSTWLGIVDQRYYLRYAASRADVADGVEPFLPAVLLAAMLKRATIRMSGDVSARLLSSLTTIQDIFHVWSPRHLYPVPIEGAAPTPPRPRIGQGIGCFFTGGVDSWYSVLKHRDEITHLVYVHGFDVRLEDWPLRTRVSAMLHDVAQHLGKSLLEVETNLHPIADRYVGWEFYHGPALASVALLLSPVLHKIYIPATHTYAALYSLGSHPLLDPLWSTEEVEIVHDGCESSRSQKVMRIALYETALRTLRVCWLNPGGAYNCGRCEKCLRTMIALRAAGALDRAPTFGELDLRAVSRIPITTAGGREHIEQNLRIMEEGGVHDPALAQALNDCLRGKYYRGLWAVARGIKNSVLPLVKAAAK